MPLPQDGPKRLSPYHPPNHLAEHDHCSLAADQRPHGISVGMTEESFRS
jgi:hypothetical protein